MLVPANPEDVGQRDVLQSERSRAGRLVMKRGSSSHWSMRVERNPGSASAEDDLSRTASSEAAFRIWADARNQFVGQRIVSEKIDRKARSAKETPEINAVKNAQGNNLLNMAEGRGHSHSRKAFRAPRSTFGRRVYGLSSWLKTEASRKEIPTRIRDIRSNCCRPAPGSAVSRCSGL